MTTVRLTCRCGHSWQHPRAEPVPSDLRDICPSCTGQHTPPPPPAPVSSVTVAQSLTEQESSAAASTPAVAPGRVVAGFEILEEINRGGMGIIYKARQTALNRMVALKAITPSKLEAPGTRARFQREVRASAKLNHPNVVTVFHTDLDGPFPYLAMEYVPGIDLLRLVRQVGALPVPDAVYYIRQAAEGLQSIYEQGLVHRDIKPSNLIVSPGPIGSPAVKPGKLPRVKILDMGLARAVLVPGSEPVEPDLTPPGVLLGTPDYVSPEQAEDSRTADIRADIFSLGGSLYFLLTGEVPFPGKTLVEKLRKALTEPAPSPAAKRKDVTPVLDAVVRKMLARAPKDRYQTPTEVIAALDRAMRGEALQPTESSSSLDMPVLPTPVAQAKAHAGPVRGLVLTPDGQTLVTAGDDSKLRLSNVASLAEVKTFLCDLGTVTGLVVGPGAKWAATTGERLSTSEMGVQLWDLATGAERKRLRGPADNLRGAAVSADGKAIVAGANDSMVWVWASDATGPKTYCMKGHAGPVTGLAFVSPESLLSAGADGTVRQWDLRVGKAKGALPAGVGPLTALAFGGKRVAVAGEALALRLPSGQFLKLTGHDGPPLCCALSPDGRLLASGGADKTVRVWSTEEGTEVVVLPAHAGPVRAVAFSPDGKFLFSGGDDGLLCKWDAPTV